MDQQLTRHQKKYWANPDHYCAKALARYYRNRERFIAYNRQWKALNKDKNRKTITAYRSTLKGKTLSLLNTAAYVAARENLPFDLTYDYLVDLVSKAIQTGAMTCEVGHPDTVSIDKIIPMNGYVRGNVQIVPWWYNAAKHDFTMEALHEAMKR